MFNRSRGQTPHAYEQKDASYQTLCALCINFCNTSSFLIT